MLTPLLIEEPILVTDPLAEWRWKLGGAKVVALSKSGDAFVIHSDGHVWWLDTGAGEVQEVADSVAAFERLLKQPQEASRLLLAPVVEEFVRVNGPIPTGRCLGFTRLPVLGGTYTIENRWLAPIVEHFAVTGETHRQIRDLPDGARVQIRVVD
jgi:hypothetical protein